MTQAGQVVQPDERCIEAGGRLRKSSACPVVNPVSSDLRMVRSAPTFLAKNRILASLPRQNLLAIRAFLEPVVLSERAVLSEARRQLDHIYFLESGLVSRRVVSVGTMFETSVVGYRGAVGVSLLLNDHIETEQHVVVVPGTAYRIQARDLFNAIADVPDLHQRLLQFARAFALHSAQAGLCGVRHGLEQRLASWLCLASDALGADVIPVTHDYLSCVLGLRRAGVTETLISFQEDGLIRKMRGVLQIDQRTHLEQRACKCCRIIASAYSASETLLSSVTSQ
ncbi:Crp/Fnr family transcriptional regulator [Bradyrhizobium embrapense]|uniref:Crp/Fnr family transcriptional regulator n=1 Tax=Bradyrhizobium embrapense TaxID=630921 RepID=UPI000A0133BF